MSYGNGSSQLDEISTAHYEVVRRFLERSCGIVLGDGKQYLIKNRLQEVLKQLAIDSFDVLVEKLQSEGMQATRVKDAVVDAMTTNETYWFRDDMQFLELKEKILPELYKIRPQGVRVWSAACSSGQEPFSISLCADELQHKGVHGSLQVLGTDISASVIQEASKAVYSELALLRGLDTQLRSQYFQTVPGGYLLKPEITRRVRFQQFNLLHSFATLGKFDLIFCRNVLIYFSEAVKCDIINRMVAALNIGGYLFLSSTESMSVDLPNIELIRGNRVRYFKKIG